MSESIAVGYVRLSQRSDRSIDAQKQAIRDYVDTTDTFTLKTIIDDGELSSGYDSDRDGYQQLLDLVDAGQLDAIVVHDTTRIGRDFDDRHTILYHPLCLC